MTNIKIKDADIEKIMKMLKIKNEQCPLLPSCLKIVPKCEYADFTTCKLFKDALLEKLLKTEMFQT